MQAVFDAAEDLGLSFRTADVGADPHGRYVGRRFVQEFEFSPASGNFRGAVDEVELVFDPSADALDVYLEVDRRGGLLSELADADERTTGFSLASADTDEALDELRNAMEQAV